MQENPPHKRYLVGCGSPFLRLAQNLSALRGWCKQCLPGRRKPDVLRPGIVGMRGSMVVRLRPCMITSISTPAPLPLGVILRGRTGRNCKHHMLRATCNPPKPGTVRPEDSPTSRCKGLRRDHFERHVPDVQTSPCCSGPRFG